MTDAKLTVELLDKWEGWAKADCLNTEAQLILIAAARASLESSGGVFSGSCRPTFALVTENGWVHVVFNDEERAMEQAAKRSVPPAEVDPLTGKHAYTVMRYAPSAPSQPAESPWVAVSAELPDTDIEVLAVTADGTRALVELDITDDSEGHGQPYWRAGFDPIPLNRFTHWMCPPEPTNGR